MNDAAGACSSLMILGSSGREKSTVVLEDVSIFVSWDASCGVVGGLECLRRLLMSSRGVPIMVRTAGLATDNLNHFGGRNETF